MLKANTEADALIRKVDLRNEVDQAIFATEKQSKTEGKASIQNVMLLNRLLFKKAQESGNLMT